MDDSWNVTEDGQQDVDQQVGTATTLEEDTEWLFVMSAFPLARRAGKRVKTPAPSGKNRGRRSEWELPGGDDWDSVGDGDILGR